MYLGGPYIHFTYRETEKRLIGWNESGNRRISPIGKDVLRQPKRDRGMNFCVLASATCASLKEENLELLHKPTNLAIHVVLAVFQKA